MTLSVPFPHSAHSIDTPVLQHLAWFVGGAVLAFLIPFVFSSALDLDNDLYYAVYFGTAVTLMAAYVMTTHVDVVGLFTRHWRLSVALGFLTAAFLVFNVIQREDSTPHPDGAYFLFTIVWRGVAYGIVDALVLTAFPVAVAYGLFSSRLDAVARRIGFAAVALILSLTITATYHLGYEQFRDDGVSGPEIGNTIISVPALVTANPIGSIVAHVSMHVTANIYAYETDLYLPPQTTAED